jgi:hypothetical protein
MKKILIPITLCIMAACSGNKGSEKSKKVWMCDSIRETWFDSTGTEQMKAYVKCDSVLQEPEKKE